MESRNLRLAVCRNETAAGLFFFSHVLLGYAGA